MGELDYLIIDLPPGTGDIQLSLVQKVPVTAAVIVTTPQNISLIDAKKAIDMFERTGVKIAGVVENMSHMMSESGEKIQLFPKGEIDSYLKSKNLLKLAAVPFNTNVSLGSESGIPIMESYSDCDEAIAIAEIARKLSELV